MRCATPCWRNRSVTDSTRQDAPLQQADDALYVDSTGLTLDDVVGQLLTYVRGEASEPAQERVAR